MLAEPHLREKARWPLEDTMPVSPSRQKHDGVYRRPWLRTLFRDYASCRWGDFRTRERSWLQLCRLSIMHWR